MCRMCPQPAIYGRADVLVDSSACSECRGYMRVADAPLGEVRDDAEYHELCRSMWGEISIATGTATVVWYVCPCCGPSSAIDIQAGIATAKQTAGSVTATPAQAPAPSLGVAGGVRETTTGADAAAAAGPIGGRDGDA